MPKNSCKVQNQVNLPNSQHGKSWSERKWKVYFKKDGNSMLLFDKLDGTNARIRCNTLKRIYSDWRGYFIVTK